MSKDSDNKIELENALRSVEGINDEKIEEIMELFSSKENVSLRPIEKKTEDEIKLKLLYETDWKKKAILSAMLISNSLKE
jgi:hypothetical protein